MTPELSSRFGVMTAPLPRPSPGSHVPTGGSTQKVNNGKENKAPVVKALRRPRHRDAADRGAGLGGSGRGHRTRLVVVTPVETTVTAPATPPGHGGDAPGADRGPARCRTEAWRPVRHGLGHGDL